MLLRKEILYLLNYALYVGQWRNLLIICFCIASCLVSFGRKGIGEPLWLHCWGERLVHLFMHWVSTENDFIGICYRNVDRKSIWFVMLLPKLVWWKFWDMGIWACWKFDDRETIGAYSGLVERGDSKREKNIWPLEKRIKVAKDYFWGTLIMDGDFDEFTFMCGRLIRCGMVSSFCH